MDKTNIARWWSLSCKHPLAEELSYELVEGISEYNPSVRVISDSEIELSFIAPQAIAQTLQEHCSALDFQDIALRMLSDSETSPETWFANCQELWQDVHRGSLTVTLVPDTTRVKGDIKNQSNLFIIPSTGFGTGHHATTGMLLTLMQRAYVANKKPIRSALDLGTGSGLLALACNKLYQSEVLAVDNDALAIDNAQQNITLNGAQGITLIHGTCEQVTGSYDLLIANIYAKVLLELPEALKNHAKPDSILLLSGLSNTSAIKASQASGSAPILSDNAAEPVIEAYQRAGWKLIERTDEDGWVALSFSL